MTPEEKAKELWMKFFQLEIELTGNGDGEHAYRYALLTVDEILKTGYDAPQWGDIRLKYWDEVKQEIEKL